jgi:ABC-2 type transport system ATP-binding protein
MVGIAVGLNPGFDEDLAIARLGELAIPVQQKVGKLSGGQRAQLALTLALARHPHLLVLDEPLASLDPLARHDFMGIVMAAVESDGLSVLFSSHVVSELERVADFLIVLSSGHLQMAGEIDDLLAQHCLLVGPAEEVEPVCAALPVIHMVVAGRRANLIVRASKAQEIPAGWECDSVSLEELVLAYLREPTAGMFPKPLALASSERIKVTR